MLAKTDCRVIPAIRCKYTFVLLTKVSSLVSSYSVSSVIASSGGYNVERELVHELGFLFKRRSVGIFTNNCLVISHMFEIFAEFLIVWFVTNH